MKFLPIKFVAVLLFFSFAFGGQNIFAQKQGSKNVKTTSRRVSINRSLNNSDDSPYRDAIRRYRDKNVKKIVGGKKVSRIEDFPWQVSLGISESVIPDPYYAHFCGGSVYSDKWIITAAHCVNGLTTEEINTIEITAGTIDLVKGGANAKVKRAIIHRNYNRATKDNDIAMLELSNPLPLNESVKTISLLTPNEANILTDAATFYVTGWGATREGDEVVRDLMYLSDIPFLDNSTCNRPLFYNRKITDNMICAGKPSGGEDSCQGDSGGPLVITTGTGTKLLAGIVSWGDGCARPNKVGVYTRVPNYVGWVSDCVSGSENCNK